MFGIFIYIDMFDFDNSNVQTELSSVLTEFENFAVNLERAI